MGSRELPAAFAERARSFVARGDAPVPALPSSSVLLVRDGVDGLEVYVHVRHTTMAFAGGMLAFPGGKADPSDARVRVQDEARWAARLGTDDASARAHVNAAIRETLEETGVQLVPHELRPWAHWITPRFEPRRYDTWFFVAAVPTDQEPRDVSGEASAVSWLNPVDALGGSGGAGPVMLPPTRTVLRDLATCADVAECLASVSVRSVETVLPGWVDDGDSVRVLLPGDDGYPGDDPGDRS